MNYLLSTPFSSTLTDLQKLKQDELQLELINNISGLPEFGVLLTCNVAGLPPEIVPASWLGSDIKQECTSLNMQSAAERRIRGFGEWLDLVEWRDDPRHKPCVIALQEVIWEPLQKLMHDILTARGYVTHKNISLVNRYPLNNQNKDKDKEKDKEETILFDGGLAIYVLKEKFQVLTGGSQIFEKRLGIDRFCGKGFMWLFCRNKLCGKQILFTTLHPQAYLDPSPFIEFITNAILAKSMSNEPSSNNSNNNPNNNSTKTVEQALTDLNETKLNELNELNRTSGERKSGGSKKEIKKETKREIEKRKEKKGGNHTKKDQLNEKEKEKEKENEKKRLWGTLVKVVEDFGDNKAEFVQKIKDVHFEQFEQVSKFIYLKLYRFLTDRQKKINLKKNKPAEKAVNGIYFIGDFNVNRWDSLPFSESEAEPKTALNGGKVSSEFKQMMQLLYARQPPIIRGPINCFDTNYFELYRDLFTWNSKLNSMAHQDVPYQEFPVLNETKNKSNEKKESELKKEVEIEIKINERKKGSMEQFQWIDYIMYSALSCFKRPQYSDNQVQTLQLPPFPDLSSYWGINCFNNNNNQKNKNEKSDDSLIIEQRLRLGNYQFGVLKQKFNEIQRLEGKPPFRLFEEVSDPASKITLKSPVFQAWVVHVRTATFGESSQVWKGFCYYGFKTHDVLTEWQRESLPTWIGSPHPFKMLHHVSDHFAVQANILF